MLKTWRISILGVLVFMAQISGAVPPPHIQEPQKPESTGVQIPEITNWDEIIKQLKADSFKGSQFARKLKIAILDNGFAGYEAEIGKSLPASTFYNDGTTNDIPFPTGVEPEEEQSIHGLLMAQVLAQVIARSGVKADYDLHLLNTDGYTKFKNQVKRVTKDKFDLVLYSQVWEYGGNGDSKGFINALVSEATNAGVIWINAAGNFNYLTKVTPVAGQTKDGEEWIVFKDENNKEIEGATVHCKTELPDQCTVRLAVAWNDFKDDPDQGTDKDLDLYLLDKDKKIIAQSERRQRMVADPNNLQTSIVPRELIRKVVIDPGTYTVRVKIKSKNFRPEKDILWVTVSGFGVELGDATVGAMLLPPADNPGVIVIGASDDFQSSQSKTLKLPEIFLKSTLKMADGSTPFSSSIAAAMAAGVAALHLAVDTEKSKEAVESKLKLISVAPEKPKAEKPKTEKPAKEQPARPAKKPKKPKRTVQTRPADTEQSRQTEEPRDESQRSSSRCVRAVKLPVIYDAAFEFMDAGGAMVGLIRGRPTILVTMGRASELGLDPEAVLVDHQDQPVPGMFVMTPNGIELFSARDIQNLPREYYPIIPVRRVAVCP